MSTDWVEWEPLNLPIGPVFGEPGSEPYELDSVSKRGLLKAGTLLRMETAGEFVLVGHINQSGGVCDDCAGFSPADCVEAYRVVWAEEDER